MVNLNLLNWSAINSLGDNREEAIKRLQSPSSLLLDDDIYPKVSEIPASLRRRLTKLTKLVSRLFFDIVPSEIQSDTSIIFLSESGEVLVLEELLENTVNGEPYSPMKFCNSVHHTPTGYISIATKNRGISKTISGGEDGFSAALLEVASLFNKDSSTPVILLVGEEKTPKIFEDKNSCPFDYAMAFLFNAKNSNSILSIDSESLLEMVQNRVTALQFCEEIIRKR